MGVKEIEVYLRLSGEMREYFDRIKRHFGVRNNTEVVRMLINIYWREEVQPYLRQLERLAPPDEPQEVF